MQKDDTNNHLALDRRARAIELLKSENWPTPSWYLEKNVWKIKTYEESFIVQLRARYIELENEFRSVLGNYPDMADIVTAVRISDILHSVKERLEHRNADLVSVSTSLDLVERYMVWLYPAWVGKARINRILLRLESLAFYGRDLLVKQLTELSTSEKESYPGQLRAVTDEAIGYMNAEVLQDHINRALQINRLRGLRSWGVVVIVVFFAASPLATNLNSIENWPSQESIKQPIEVCTWMNALAMMTLGAVGGFLSGLLQARSTRINLAEYLEDALKLQLRPLVGAMVALISYILLTWQVLPGINVENAGSYFVIAFLSGFSERYFLQLLRSEPEKLPGEPSTSKQAAQ